MKALETLLTPDLMFLSEVINHIRKNQILINQFSSYKIINNKFCEIDVDKWDYILRDSYYLKNAVQTSTDFGMFFNDARITKMNKTTHISYNKKHYTYIYQLFQNRYILHKNCYQNATVAIIERMMIEAFLEAERCDFQIKGIKLSEAHLDLNVYKYLDDTIVNYIEITDNLDCNEAKNIIKKLKERKLYKKLFQSSVSIDLDCLNNEFGNYFIEIHQKIPFACETMPKSLILHDDLGNIVCSSA